MIDRLAEPCVRFVAVGGVLLLAACGEATPVADYERERAVAPSGESPAPGTEPEPSR